MKEIIVNSAEDKSIITVVENGNLLEKYEEYDSLERLEGNIYFGKVVDILPGMQAAFVDIGDNKNAFLHIKDILPKVSNQTGNKNEDLNKYNIRDYVKTGMPVIVEVKKDKTDKKGAKVSTNLNIAGKFVVIIPNSEFITLSQKIEDKKEIERLNNIVNKLEVDNYGIIIRTSAINASEEQIKEDIKEVICIYENIKNNADKIIKNKEKIPTLLYEKGSIIKRLLLDIGHQGLDKVIVNSESASNLVKELLKGINLKIDVEFIKKENIEKTVLKVNSEATIEIAKQIRARDIGGIVIIDYIDMDKKEDEEIIQNLLLEHLKKDRAKTQVVGFTKLHLLEMTRKHICS